MELFIFARFHAKEGFEAEVHKALTVQVAVTRKEPGCLVINAFRSTRDPRQFFIHSRWRDEAAFEVHAEIENTNAFVARMEELIDHPFDVSRTHVVA